jgi:integral membrane protein
VHKIVNLYNKTHWFTDKEAWTLYRVFAFTEAIGWTLLISAIIYRSLHMPGAAIAISIAGTVHGLLFSLYFLFVLLTARSMKWGPWRISAALLSGMPPYMSLIYEKIIAYHRRKYPVYVEPPADID